MSMNIPKSTVPSVAHMRSALPSSEINKSSRMRAKSEHGIKEKAVEAEAEAEAKANTKAKAIARAKAMAEADMEARATAKAKAKAAAKAAALANVQRAQEEAAAARARIPSWERSKYDAEQAGTSETPYGV